jgi:DnaK suppressor protein
MRRRELDRYRTILETQLESLVGHRDVAVHEMVGGDAEDLPDPTDRATAESDRTWSLRLHDRDRRLASKIRAALERLQEGTFGVCESCSRPISQARLRARPVTTFCIDCKTESERQER